MKNKLIAIIGEGELWVLGCERKNMMKYKLIAFDVTKALEMSVGDRVEGIDPADSNAAEKLRETGVPFAKLSSAGSIDFGEIMEYFQKEISAHELTRELSSDFGFPMAFYIPSNQIGIDFGNKKSVDRLLKRLENLPKTKRDKIKTVHIYGSDVTVAGLKSLKSFENLSELNCGSTLITDAEVKELEGLPNLRELEIKFTNVSMTGIGRLRYKNPELRIVWR
jgi:hypothetical protein